jgi:hypothetical protein
MMRTLCLLPLLACSGGDKDTTPTTPDTGTAPTGPEWSIVVEEGPGGMMLGAYSAGDAMLVVGGQINDHTGTIWRLENNQLCAEELAADGVLWWIHGRSATDFTIVGENGIIVHELNGVRTREDVPTDATLFGVFDDGTDVWAVGGDVFGSQQGEIWRKQGGTWTLQANTPGLAFKVWEGWVVGNGFAWRWNGTDFDDLTPPSAPRITTIRGTGPDDVYMVGGQQVPEFHHFDGTEWTTPTLDPGCIGQALNGVYTAPGEDVFVVGMFGVAASYDGTEWSCAEQPLTVQHFHAVWPHDGSYWALGGNFTSTITQFATVGRYGEGEPPEVVGACE